MFIVQVLKLDTKYILLLNIMKRLTLEDLHGQDSEKFWREMDCIIAVYPAPRGWRRLLYRVLRWLGIRRV